MRYDTKPPCELIVWYLLPSLRRELARILVEECHLTQREAARKLGMTESAVSQYLRSKRGNEMKFDREIIDEIEKHARKIANSGESPSIAECTCSLCSLIKDHRGLDELYQIVEKKGARCEKVRK